METNNLDSLNQKNPHHQVWKYTSYFNPMDFKIRKSKKFHYILCSLGIIVFILMIYYFFDMLFLIIKLTKV